VESFPPGTLKGLVVEGLPILLCNLNGEFFGYRNVCAGSALPMDGGKLNGYVLLCPWHNCLYDVRTGKRVDGRSGRLEVIPVAVREGMLQLTLKTESMPLLSAPRQGPLTSGSGS
jgi:nitrite reductase/ring-hydroxylating ferredoxin subunit